MAVFPIYLGAKASVKAKRNREEAIARGEEVDEAETETLTTKDAMKFPLVASCALGSLYLIIKNVDPSYVNILLGGYFMLAGLFATTAMLVEMGWLDNLF